MKKKEYPIASCCVGQSSCWNYHSHKKGIFPYTLFKTEEEKIAYCHGCLNERWRIINRPQAKKGEHRGKE